MFTYLLSPGVCTADLNETTRVKKQFLEAAVDAYCSDATRIEDKLSSEIVDTINQLDDIRVPFDPAPILHMACLNVTLNLTFSQRFDPAGRMANEIFKTYEWRYVTFLLPLRSACLTVCLRVCDCLPVCLSLSSSLSMSVCLSVCLSVSAYLSVCLSPCLCLWALCAVRPKIYVSTQMNAINN